MKGKKLEKVNEEIDSRVIVRSNFKVSNQCITAAKRGNQILGLIKRTITSRKGEVILRLYKSLVRPHLGYCVQVYRQDGSRNIEAFN